MSVARRTRLANSTTWPRKKRAPEISSPLNKTRCLRPEHFAIVLFAILTGLSRDEQFSLKWSEVDFAASRLQVRGRNVPLHQKACAVLAALLPLRTTEWIFEGKGGPTNAHNLVTRIFRSALAEAGIADFTWQDLRFTCGARMAAAGVAPHVVGKFLGVGVRSVITSYGHLVSAELTSAVAAL